MKKIILSLTLLATIGTAFAAQTNIVRLEESDVALEPIKDGEIISQERMCQGETNCLIDGEVVRIELPLGGCLDRLGHVTYAAKQVSTGNIELSIAATRIVSSDSFAALCQSMPRQTIEITLPQYYGKVSLKFLRPLIHR